MTDAGDVSRHDRVVVVGGSSRGIGRAVVQRLADEGVAVVVNGRDAGVVDGVVAEITAAGGAAVGVVGSVSDPAVAYRMIDTAREHFGRVDAAINCAGVAEPPRSSVLTIDSEEFARQIDAHLMTSFELTRAAATTFVEQGAGSIVLTGSAAASGAFGGSGYPAAKGGVTALALAAAAELRAYGVRVNVVLPGARTRLSTGGDYVAHIDSLHGRGLLDAGTHAAALDPADPEYVAPLYAYLVSDRASAITGQVFSAAGNFLGRHTEPPLELLAYRGHTDDPPYTLDEIDAAVASLVR